MFKILIKAFGKNNVMSKTSMYRCYNEFLKGREKVEYEARAGRPPTAQNKMMINTARCIIRKECRIIVCELATQSDISVGSAQSFLWDNLQTTRVCC